MRPGFALLGAALLAAGCARRPAVVAPGAHYVVGPGYQRAGVWFYPREDFHYAATGIGVVQGTTGISVQGDASGVTADGEAIDPSALTAAHQTLQLPAIARVTDLDTGAQVMVRVNDRGPDTPHRLIGLSRRAGALLGLAPGASAPVRVEVDEGMSVALRDRLNGGPQLAMQAAPRGAVTAEALAPPPGVGQSARGRGALGATEVTAAPATAAAVPERLPETVRRVAAGHGPLMIEAGVFGQMGYAHQVAARLSGIGAQVRRQREGRAERYGVVAGPYADVAAADAALDRALRAGVTDARIVVE